ARGSGIWRGRDIPDGNARNVLLDAEGQARLRARHHARVLTVRKRHYSLAGGDLDLGNFLARIVYRSWHYQFVLGSSVGLVLQKRSDPAKGDPARENRNAPAVRRQEK